MVNNQVHYITDWEHGGKKDQWYGPEETIRVGGDCDEFSLLKAVLLYHRGWSRGDMAFVVGILPTGEAHMMLGIVFANGGQAMLDNLSNQLRPRPFNSWAPLYQINGIKPTVAFLKVK